MSMQTIIEKVQRFKIFRDHTLILHYDVKTNKYILSYVNLLRFICTFLVSISHKIENLKPVKNFLRSSEYVVNTLRTGDADLRF